MLLDFDHALVSWIKQGLLASALRSILTWQYIQKKCKNQPFQSIDKLQSFLLMISWGGIERGNYITCSERLPETHSFVIDSHVPPGTPSSQPSFHLSPTHPHSPLPSQAAAPFLPLGRILLSGELCIFSYVGQFSFSHCFIPQHGAPGQHQNSLRTPKMPNIK